MRAEAGAILEKLDKQTKAAVGEEMRFHPSTYRMASLGGFIAGGSGGVGSIRWGGLRNFGNLLGLRSSPARPSRASSISTGEDILKVAHAYGTNGIIVEAEIPLTAAYDWVDVMVGFDDVMDACAFAEHGRPCRMACCSRRSRRSRRRSRTTISPATSPISTAATSRSSLLMAAPVAIDRAGDLRRRPEGRHALPLRQRQRRGDARGCRRSTSWPGTTRRCAALKVDPDDHLSPDAVSRRRGTSKR